MNAFSPCKFWLTLIIALFAAIVAMPQTDDEPISVDSELVIINAVVTDSKGNPVTNLKRQEFSVLENGEEQKIDFFEAGTTPFAAVILLDSSGSMENRVSLARSAAIQFLDKLRMNDVAAIYNFDSKISLVQDFSGSRDIYEGVFDVKAKGMTVLNDAIVRAADELDKRSEKRRAIIVLSDGADTQSNATSEFALKRALKANAVIYTVDMTGLNGARSREDMINKGVLEKLSDRTGGRYISSPGGAALREAFKNIVDELGRQYTIAYYPTNDKRDGKWRPIEVRTKTPGLVVRSRKGYNAPKK